MHWQPPPWLIAITGMLLGAAVWPFDSGERADARFAVCLQGFRQLRKLTAGYDISQPLRNIRLEQADTSLLSPSDPSVHGLHP